MREYNPHELNWGYYDDDGNYNPPSRPYKNGCSPPKSGCSCEPKDKTIAKIDRLKTLVSELEDRVEELVKKSKVRCEDPKKPLIKDEKIRKAVRAWAEVNNTDKVCVQNNYCLSAEEDEEVEIVFALPAFKELYDFDDFIDITKLCGEEE